MKKILFVFLVVLILTSCQTDFDDVNYKIFNRSSKTITCDFNNETLTLLPDKESDNIIINSGKGSFKPLNLVFSGHKESIKMNTVNKGRAGIEYSFYDVEPFTLHVLNNLPMEVTITAGNFIDNNGETEITIAAGEKVTAKIYTKKPSFSIKSDEPVIFPVNTNWQFSDETISVVIQY